MKKILFLFNILLLAGLGFGQPVDINVNWKCNMEIEILSGRFTTSDTVSARGYFNSWGRYNLIADPINHNNYISQSAVLIPQLEVGDTIEYKFFYTPNTWEQNENRIYIITQADYNAREVTISRSFNDVTLETVTNQETIILFTVDTKGAVSAINGLSFPIVNTVRIVGGSFPLQWPGSWSNSDSTFTIPLFDDGTHGDVTSGDKIFSSNITFPAYTPFSVTYKYSINWGDDANNGGGNGNEAGFGSDHIIELARFLASAKVENVFGTMGLHGLINLVDAYPVTININTTYNFGNSSSTSSYQIIGIPGANNLAIANVMSGSPGKEGDWRAFWDPGAGDYIEYNGSTIFNLKPGKAFWVISKNPINFNHSVSTVNLTADNTYSITLQSEWNLISNPFEKNINWSIVQNLNGITQPINFFQTGNYSNPANLEPYKGYYFYNNPSLGMSNLKIPYYTTNLLPKKNLENLEELKIALKNNDSEMGIIKIGISGDAKQGVDMLDMFSPPSQFCEISMSLLNNNLETKYKYLEKEFRPEIGNGQEYNIVVKNSSDKTLELVATGLENFNKYEIYILDNSLMKLYDLKEPNKIEVKSNTSFKEYTLFIGTQEYILQKKSSLIPTEYDLYQNYPNPFNPSTTILFALPQQSKVSLKIYNILGEVIAELINDQLYEEGYHEIIFNGSLLSSGVYFYRIQAGDFLGIKKMLLLK